MVKSFLTRNSFQTRKLGAVFAKEVLKTQLNKKALVIGLEGELGGGKTTFLQGLAKGLGIKEKVLSPSFVIFKKFQIPDPKAKIFYHIDCYRIRKPKEILDLDFKKIITDSKNIVAIEWANRIQKILPPNIILIKFQIVNKNERKIIFSLDNTSSLRS